MDKAAWYNVEGKKKEKKNRYTARVISRQRPTAKYAQINPFRTSIVPQLSLKLINSYKMHK